MHIFKKIFCINTFFFEVNLCLYNSFFQSYCYWFEAIFWCVCAKIDSSSKNCYSNSRHFTARSPAFKYILLQKSPIKIAPNLRHFPITATLCIAHRRRRNAIARRLSFADRERHRLHSNSGVDSSINIKNLVFWSNPIHDFEVQDFGRWTWVWSCTKTIHHCPNYLSR